MAPLHAAFGMSKALDTKKVDVVMKERLPKWMPVTALLLIPVFGAHAQSVPLPPETQIVATAGAPAPTQETFTISSAQDLVATFTDLQIPSALTSASVVVTQGSAIVGMTTLASPATTASISLPAAIGQYTLRVIGVPGSSNVGTFTVCVAPKSTPAACIQNASLSGNITVQSSPADPTVSTLSTTLTVATSGSYTFTYQDNQFPVALNTPPSLALFQGSNLVAVPLSASPATYTLQAGTYTLFAVAQADSTVKAGLYGITVTGPSGTQPLLDSSFPVGLLSPATVVTNPTAQTLTLNASDLGFPGPLASGSVAALATSGGSSLGIAGTGGAATLTLAPAGPIQVWTTAVAGTTAGTYAISLASTSQVLLQTAFGVNNGSDLAYAFVTPTALAAGSYQATATDFQFPAALTGLKFAVAQNGTLVQSASAAGTFTFTAAAGLVVVLVDATTTAGGSGMFDVNIQTAGATPQIVYDQTQGAGATGVFTAQTVTLPAGNFDLTLSDLQFPAQFSTLALLVSNNGAVVGKIFGGGTFTIAATAGAYQLNFVTTPGGTQAQYGLYGLQVGVTAPTVTLAASPTTVTSGSTTTLTWTSTNAASCTGSGGTFSGSGTSGNASVTVSATTTYSITCTGSSGGSAVQSVTVTATAAAASGGGGGGGSMGMSALGMLAGLASLRLLSSRRRSLTRAASLR